LNRLLPFAADFIEGFTAGAVEEYARQAPPGRVSSPHGYDFRRHMLALTEATGIHLANLNEEHAGFHLSCGGEGYVALAMPAGDMIAFDVFSRLEFPRGEIPAELVWAVNNLNRPLPHCAFAILEIDDTCVCYAHGLATALVLTPQLFEAVLTDLVSCVCRLDGWLIEHGFAR
jgi:hypothetical protein